MTNRRTFIKSVSGTVFAHAIAGKASASDRIRVAVLGVNGRGKDHIQNFQGLPETEVAVLCDPDRNVAAERAAEFEKKYGKISAGVPATLGNF